VANVRASCRNDDFDFWQRGIALTTHQANKKTHSDGAASGGFLFFDLICLITITITGALIGLTINAPGTGARCQHVVEHIPHMSYGKRSKERAGTTAIIHRVRMWVCKALADQREMGTDNKAENGLDGNGKKGHA
jgi:hypothetical protein